MRYPKWFARWRLQVWDNRLTDWRKEWNRATLVGPDRQWAEQAIDGVTQEAFWERLVTKALLKRTTWRKRAGVRKLSAAPRSDMPDPGQS